MSEKYLIEKSSLTALADITRAYNETPDKEYSLAEVTEQVRKASENYYNLFEDGIDEIKSETATTLSPGSFSGALHASGLGIIDLPNVVNIYRNALSFNQIRVLNMPKLEDIGQYAFSGINIKSSIYFPSVKSVGNYAFTDFSKNGNSTNYCVYFPVLETLGTGAFNSSLSRIILKTLPVLSGLPNWGSTRSVNILMTQENYDIAVSGTEANWGELSGYLTRATSYDADYTKYWRNFVEKGILTEREIRRDYYGEEV